ncbi:MAG: SGNH/GDSL hydrolase family protein [Actinomycetota bacterium]|nr:SGNH/GDSL hydrolase family protein [Actinomycetota bacterium]
MEIPIVIEQRDALVSYTRFVAIGDSLTEGVGDPVRGGRLRGWADRLADILRLVEPGLRYFNLARRGLTTRQVRDGQLERALELEPDLTSVLVGMNDLIRPDFDAAAYERDLEELVDTFTSRGVTVLTGTFPDVTAVIPVPARLTASIRRRLDAASEVIRRVSARHGTVLVDVNDMPDELIRANFSIDGLHPNERGHLLIARSFAVKLGIETGLPDLPRGRLVGWGSFRHARWLVAEGALPQMTRTAVRIFKGAPTADL